MEKIREKIFGYAGLDFILDKNGILHFLEANDHPVGLNRADKLSSGQNDSIFNVSGNDYLVDFLLDCCGNNCICLLLPDCFIIDKKNHCAPNVTLKEKHLYEGRIKLTIDDFNQLANSIHKKYPKVFIVDKKGILWRGRNGTLLTGEEVSLIYRRSSQIPLMKIHPICINDIRLRPICTNKSLTNKLIHDHLPYANAIKSYSFRDMKNLILNNSEKDSWIIQKPIYGSASQGVQRIKSSEFLKPTFAYSKDSIFQIWIEPTTLRKNRFKYYYDIRIFVINGKAVAGFGRQSAAPVLGVAKDTPLSWCTTTGPSIPIISNNSQNSSCVNLTAEQTGHLIDLSEKIVTILNNFASKTTYQNIKQKNIDFKTLHNINEKVKYIYLV